MSDASLIGGESFGKLRTELTMRLPGDLTAAFQEEVQGLRSTPCSGIELLDALDQVHVGLGVAIGRGTTGEDARYERLGKLVAWLYEELGRPQDSRYAVVVRAAIALREREEKRRGAGYHAMSSRISAAAAARNEQLLAEVEKLGGGYVWDAEVFAVTLMDVAVADIEARALAGLVGVLQIALDCSRVSIRTLREIAAIPGLQSLVLRNPACRPEELDSLRSVGPDVDVVDE